MISRMVDIVMIRTFEQTKIERFAAHSRVPVINGLTNEYHPCQILADIFTFIEHRGPIAGKTVAWVGDGNNMGNTWLQAADILGFTRAREHAARLRGRPGERGPARHATASRSSPTRCEACRGADLVTTDVWTSMGYEAENEARTQRLRRLARRRGDDGAPPSPTRCSCTACPRTAARRSTPR